MASSIGTGASTVACAPTPATEHGERSHYSGGDERARCRSAASRPSDTVATTDADEGDEAGVAEVAEPARRGGRRRRRARPDRGRRRSVPRRPSAGRDRRRSGHRRERRRSARAGPGCARPRPASSTPRPGTSPRRPAGRGRPGSAGSWARTRPRSRGASRSAGRGGAGATTRGGVRLDVGQERAGVRSRHGSDRHGSDRAGRRHRRLAEGGEELVGTLQRREELDGGGPRQRESTALQTCGEPRGAGAAVGAARRIGVRRHECQYLIS